MVSLRLPLISLFSQQTPGFHAALYGFSCLIAFSGLLYVGNILETETWLC